LNIYLLQRQDLHHYGEYDSCVVVAETEEKAKQIHPTAGDLYSNREDRMNSWNNSSFMTSWVDIDKINVALIGKADPSQKENTVICSSFNAG
jgi:hypothetical protein